MQVHEKKHSKDKCAQLSEERMRKIERNIRGHRDRSGRHDFKELARKNGISFFNTDYRGIKRHFQEKEEWLSGEEHFKGRVRGKNGESRRKQRKHGWKRLFFFLKKQKKHTCHLLLSTKLSRSTMTAEHWVICCFANSVELMLAGNM